MPDQTIRVSAVLLRDERGRILTVRKRGTSRFMLPGGKPEPGESAAETAVREAAEEIGADLRVGSLRLIGVFTTAAANEPGYELISTVFAHPSVEIRGVAAEIEELRWLDLSVPLSDDLAPSLTDAILPLLREKGAG